MPDKKITPSQPEPVQPGPQLVPVVIRPVETISEEEYRQLHAAYRAEVRAYGERIKVWCQEGGTEEAFVEKYPFPKEPARMRLPRRSEGDAVAVGDAIPGILTRMASKVGVELGAA